MSVKTAMIMAAGLGTRFGRYTEFIPKGFVEVGGRTMIHRSLDALLDCGIERIVIGTGYHRAFFEALQKDYPQVETCFSPRYAETNSMYTLWNAREQLKGEDFLLLESDLVYERRALEVLLDCPHPDVMLTSPVTKFQDQYYVACDEKRRLTHCSVNKEELTPDGELVGIHKLSASFFRQMCADYATLAASRPKLGYEFELLRMATRGWTVHVLREDGLVWYEIDDEADLCYAEQHVVALLDRQDAFLMKKCNFAVIK